MLKKFKDWMAFNPPSAATIDEWYEFDKKFKEDAPIRHFLVKGKFKKFSFRIKFYLQKISDFFIYRFLNKYHIVDSKLPPQYHEAEKVLLHSAFSILVDYVEITSSLKCAKTEDFKNILEWKRFLPWVFIRDNFRSRTLGTEHLKWEIGLTKESPRQSECATEVLYLYTWWKDIRPERKPIDCPVKLDNQYPLAVLSETWRKNNAESYNKWKEWVDASNKQEEEWNEEDDEMLIRLVKIRRCLY